jgi:hypothetical protein
MEYLKIIDIYIKHKSKRYYEKYPWSKHPFTIAHIMLQFFCETEVVLKTIKLPGTTVLDNPTLKLVYILNDNVDKNLKSAPSIPNIIAPTAIDDSIIND